MSKPVTKCVCHNITFEILKKICEGHNIDSTDELVMRGFCGTNCGMCRSYIDLMLETGETAFHPDDLLTS